MEEFQKEMRKRLHKIVLAAKEARGYCQAAEFEGCVHYEHLLNLRQDIEAAIDYYANEVPACSREDITRMVAKDRKDHICQNCQKHWTDDELKDIEDIDQRVAPGEPMPSGECPECGALCQLKGGR